MSHLKLSERDGGVAVLEIDRPPANAMDVTLLRELNEAVAGIAAAAPRALVLAGRPGFFSGGADLKAVPGYGPAEQREMVSGINEMALGVYGLPCPVVGAITGHAIAGGLVLALCTDIRVVSTEGRYGLTRRPRSESSRQSSRRRRRACWRSATRSSTAPRRRVWACSTRPSPPSG